MSVRSAACRRERPGTLRAYVWPLPKASLSACNPQRECKEKLNTERAEEEGYREGNGGQEGGERREMYSKGGVGKESGGRSG